MSLIPPLLVFTPRVPWFSRHLCATDGPLHRASFLPLGKAQVEEGQVAAEACAVVRSAAGLSRDSFVNKHQGNHEKLVSQPHCLLDLSTIAVSQHH